MFWVFRIVIGRFQGRGSEVLGSGLRVDTGFNGLGFKGLKGLGLGFRG